MPHHPFGLSDATIVDEEEAKTTPTGTLPAVPGAKPSAAPSEAKDADRKDVETASKDADASSPTTLPSIGSKVIPPRPPNLLLSSASGSHFSSPASGFSSARSNASSRSTSTKSSFSTAAEPCPICGVTEDSMPAMLTHLEGCLEAERDASPQTRDRVNTRMARIRYEMKIAMRRGLGSFLGCANTVLMQRTSYPVQGSMYTELAKCPSCAYDFHAMTIADTILHLKLCAVGQAESSPKGDDRNEEAESRCAALARIMQYEEKLKMNRKKKVVVMQRMVKALTPRMTPTASQPLSPRPPPPNDLPPSASGNKGGNMNDLLVQDAGKSPGDDRPASRGWQSLKNSFNSPSGIVGYDL